MRPPCAVEYGWGLQRVSPRLEIFGEFTKHRLVGGGARAKDHVDRGEPRQNPSPRELPPLASQPVTCHCRRSVAGHNHTKPGMTCVVGIPRDVRSEEHTSELQSHSFISYAVFCLNK